ncbi:MAG: DUF362 domain-containing protein [Verrucomicrobiota bacterium]
MRTQPLLNRRHFLKTAALAGGALALHRLSPVDAAPLTTTSQVSLTAGNDHVDIIFQGLQRFKKQIAAAIGNRPILVKPNCVIGTSNNGHGDVLLSDTPVDCLEAILEFLASIGKTDVLIAEACATDPTMVAFANNNYFSLLRKFPVRFKDLNEEGYETRLVWNTNASASTPLQQVRISKMLLNPDYFVISAAKAKTHNYVIATLSLKNIVMASPVIDANRFRNTGNWQNDKGYMHSASGNNASGGGNNSQDLNDNLVRLGAQLAPDLSVIDCYQGMQGTGPCLGTAVNQRAAIVSLDWLAADRVGVELMDINAGIVSRGYSNNSGFNWPRYPAYLSYAGQLGMGQYDLSKIEVLGETIASRKMTYGLGTAYISDTSSIASQVNMALNPRIAA